MTSPPRGQYERSPNAAATTVGDRVVLYHRLSRTAVVLNPTAGWMWERLDASRTAADLVGDLRQRYPSLSLEDAARDVEAFLADLDRHALVLIRS